MRLEQLSHFLVVLESGSIREAARRLGLSQPALSKSLRLLESELNAQLLQRSRQGIRATPAGLTFAVRARAVHAELRKAKEEVMRGYPLGETRVAFGIGQALAMLIMSEAINRFRQRWPLARIRITEGLPDTLLPLVRDETLDFAMGGRVERMPHNISFKPLFRSARVIIGRKGHPLAGAHSVADLTGAEWIRTPPLEAANGPLERFLLGGWPAGAHCHHRVRVLPHRDVLAGQYGHAGVDVPAATDHAVWFALPAGHPGARTLPGFTVGMYTRNDVPLTPAADAMSRAMAAVARKLSSTREG